MQSPAAPLRLLLGLALFLGSVLHAYSQVTYSTQASFVGQLRTGYYSVDFQNYRNNTDGNLGVTFLNYSGGTPAYTFRLSTAAGNLYVNQDNLTYTRWMSNTAENASITLTFNSGNVTSFGGNLFLTDEPEAALNGTVSVSVNGGAAYTLSSVATGSQPFFGLSFLDGTRINTVTISTSVAGAYVTLDNLFVGQTAIPEPATTGLALGVAGLAGVAYFRRRQRAA